MPSPYGNIASSTGEDFVDELASNIVYNETNKIMKQVNEKLDLDPDSYVDEALSGALMTLQYGLMNATIMVVTEYAIAKAGILFTGLIAFIKGRNVFKVLGTKSSKLLGKIGGSRGRMAGKALGRFTSLIMGTQEETLAVAKMANDSGNNIVSAIGRERQNQILMHNQKVQRVDNAKSNLYKTRGNSREQKMNLYYDKFKRGNWKKTVKDKELYQNCTGQDFSKSSLSWTVDFVAKLNSYTEFVKTAEGEIVSNAKATLQLINQSGAKVLR